MEPFKFIRSIEELLYDLAMSLILFPVTLWRILVAPVRMAQVIEDEAGDPGEGHYSDNLNPPLCFLFAILAAHYLAIPFGAPEIMRSGSHLARLAMASEENTLLFRAATFTIWPVIGALVSRHVRAVPLDRNLLRPIFYQQFYLAAPFTLIVSFAVSISSEFANLHMGMMWTIMVTAAAWYVWAQVQIARDIAGCGTARAVVLALAILAAGAGAFVVLMLLAMRI